MSEENKPEQLVKKTAYALKAISIQDFVNFKENEEGQQVPAGLKTKEEIDAIVSMLSDMPHVQETIGNLLSSFLQMERQFIDSQTRLEKAVACINACSSNYQAGQDLIKACGTGL